VSVNRGRIICYSQNAEFTQCGQVSSSDCRQVVALQVSADYNNTPHASCYIELSIVYSTGPSSGQDQKSYLIGLFVARLC